MQAFSISDLGPSPFLPGFRLVDAFLPSGIRLRAAVSAPAVHAAAKTPLMMVHGHPHNHLVWRKVAPQLANERPVVLPDLRGYGDREEAMRVLSLLEFGSEQSFSEYIRALLGEVSIPDELWERDVNELLENPRKLKNYPFQLDHDRLWAMR